MDPNLPDFPMLSDPIFRELLGALANGSITLPPPPIFPPASLPLTPTTSPALSIPFLTRMSPSLTAPTVIRAKTSLGSAAQPRNAQPPTPPAPPQGSPAVGELAGRGRGRGRGPGRPRLDSPVPCRAPPGLGDACFGVIAYSLTINCASTGVPKSWHEKLQAWCAEYCVRGIFSIEVGPRASHSHYQCAFECRAPQGKQGLDLIRKLIREALNITPTHRATLVLKEFGTNQTFPEMVGYCMKDKGQNHFDEMRVNVSDADVEAGVMAYGLVRPSYADGKKEITKASLFKVAFLFWNYNLFPVRDHFRLDHVLRLMLCSGEWMPAATWVITGQGSGLDFEKGESLWEIVMAADCANITIEQVQSVFFGTPQRTMRMQPDPCGYDAVSLADAREFAMQLRTGVLTAEDHEASRREEFGAYCAASRARMDRERDCEEMEEVDVDPRVSFGSPSTSRRPYRRGDCVVRTPPSMANQGPAPCYDEEEVEEEDEEEDGFVLLPRDTPVHRNGEPPNKGPAMDGPSGS
ncbi:hypothetical protein COCOBI_02-6500 [Coccomyxa sp. Obi]|nr:hypothetical protein COCOBI_02-6500 [Coccomyxa sp. Obi]